MNIEELKLILNMLTTLGTEGKEAFIWWLVFDNVPGFILCLGVIALGFYLVKKCIGLAVQGDYHEFLTETRDILKIGSPGALTNSESIQTKRLLKELAAKHSAQT